MVQRIPADTISVVSDAADDISTLLCHRCSSVLTPGEGNYYVVRIESFADPTPPSAAAQEKPESSDFDIDQLIDSMRSYSEQELMDQVYRKMTLHLCARCYTWWIEDPTG